MKKTIIITLALAIVLITGCNKLKDFGNTNTNPAATNNPITAALLTNVESGLGSTWTGQASYCQYFSETQYPSVSLYSLNLASPMAIYSGNLYDLQNIIINNTDASLKGAALLNGANENQIAIARILKAYIFWTITDRWGDVPYFGTLKGDPNVYFTQQDSIYKDLINELTLSVAQFTTTGAPIKGDIIYGGNVAQWQKLANSMRMLMALRLSKVYPAPTDYAATQFKAALADPAGSIAVNADNFMISYPGSNFKNIFYSLYDGRNDWAESATMTTLMTSLNDSRQTAFGANGTGGASSLGVPYGRTRDFTDPWVQANTAAYAWVLNPTNRTQTSPLFIVTAANVLLARAEAADRGWTSETANTSTLYQAGITASFAQWGLPAPSAAYLSSAPVALPNAFGTGLNLSFLATQQYVAYYPDGMQGWSNWRRTNVPALVPAPDATNSPAVIPRRYMYGTNDYSLAAAATTAAAARLTGGDLMNSRIWWDK
jgi:hypothetical protein